MKKNQSSQEKSGETSADDPIIIKKYSNRRLYNTAQSKYIVLSDVIELVNAGTDFVIEDAKTGENITRAVLNQIIFEHETKPQEFLFPLEFQKQLIKMYGDSYGHLIPDFLTQSLNYFAAERAELTTAWQQAMAQSSETFLKQSEAMAKQNMELFRRTWDVFGLMDSTESEPAQPGEDKSKQEAPDLESLQDQLNALQEQVKALKT